MCLVAGSSGRSQSDRPRGSGLGRGPGKLLLPSPLSFFAVLPLSEIGNIGPWRYFTGINSSDQPNFVFGEENARPLPPLGNERSAEPGRSPVEILAMGACAAVRLP